MDNQAVFVAARRTMITDSGAHGPGTMITLPAEEAVRMTKLGFVQDTPPDLAPPPPANPLNLSLQEGQEATRLFVGRR